MISKTTCFILFLLMPLTTAIDCSTYTNATTSYGPSMCRCATGYTWDNAASPIGCYINCSAVAWSTGASSTQQSCVCQPNFLWNSFNEKCWVACSGYPLTNGTINEITCQCVTGYYWNSTEMACWLDCAVLANTNTTTGNPNSTDCYCNDGYLWNSTAMVCYLDCSNVSNSTGSNPSTDPLACECRVGFAWSEGACNLDCPNMMYSTDQTSDLDGSCICSDGYRWDTTLLLCLADHSPSLVGLAYGLGLGIPLGIAALVLIGFLIYYIAVPDPSRQMAAASTLSVAQPLRPAALPTPYPTPGQYPSAFIVIYWSIIRANRTSPRLCSTFNLKCLTFRTACLTSNRDGDTANFTNNLIENCNTKVKSSARFVMSLGIRS